MESRYSISEPVQKEAKTLAELLIEHERRYDWMVGAVFTDKAGKRLKIEGWRHDKGVRTGSFRCSVLGEPEFGNYIVWPEYVKRRLDELTEKIGSHSVH